MRYTGNHIAVVNTAPTVTLIIPVEVAQAVRGFCCDRNIGLDKTLWREFYSPLWVVLNDYERQQRAARATEYAAQDEQDPDPPEDMCPGNCFLCEGCGQ